jgi:ABC transporter with metal-binding/Fe-S-binding domain ATP-binding protein
MKVAVLFSGGKDSCLALHKAVEEGHEVKFLLTILPSNKDSFMFHKPIPDILSSQAEELGIELITRKSSGEKEKELSDLEFLFQEVHEKVEGIVVGGIASSYQGNRINKICEKYSMEFLAPLWDYKPEQVWEELLKEKFNVILTKISCDGIGKEWIGKEIGEKEFKELKKISERHKFRIDFEGGEAESAVLWMPEFRKKINIKFRIKSEGNYRHFLIIE